MELDKLELPIYTVHHLYRNSLIKLGAEARPNAVKIDTIKFLGGNQQRIIMVINNENYPFLDDSELTFLTKVIAACKLTLADIAVVNINAIRDNIIEGIKSTLKPKKLVMFGVSSLMLNLPFQIPEFQVQEYDNTQYLTVPLLSIIEKDQELKKHLWGCFQKMFL